MKFLRFWGKGLRGCKVYIRRRVVLWITNFVSVDPSFRPLQILKIFLLRIIGSKIGKGSVISENFYTLYGHNLTTGDNCSIGAHCRIFDFCPISIGSELLASHGLTLISATHDANTYSEIPGPITIGSGVWIGINVTIIGPVKIGNNAVIGAGSIVIRDIPENAIVAGVPARIIRLKRSSEIPG